MSYSKIVDQNGNFADYNTVMTVDEFMAIQDKMQQRNSNKRTKERKNRITYYKHQRILGISILTVGIVVLLIGHFIGSQIMQALGALIGVTGLYIMVTKQMILVDNYFLECQDRMYHH